MRGLEVFRSLEVLVAVYPVKDKGEFLFTVFEFDTTLTTLLFVSLLLLFVCIQVISVVLLL